MNLPRPYQIELSEAAQLRGPLVIQPKLDGIRAYSDGKRWIGKDGQTLSVDLPLSPAGCDGELWHPEMTFAEVLSEFRKGGGRLQHWTFSGPSSGLDVPSRTVTGPEVEAAHAENLARGYEGSVLRGEDGQLYKLKPILDFEAEMLDYSGLSGSFRPLPNPSGESAQDDFKCRIPGGVFPGDVVTIICNGLTKNGKPRNARLK